MKWLQAVRQLARVRSRRYSGFHDTLDHVTGIEKRELLAHMAGDCDPFRIMAIKKGQYMIPLLFLTQKIILWSSFGRVT